MKTWNPQYKILDRWRGFAALCDSIWFLLLQIPGWIVPIAAIYIFFRLIEKPTIQWRHHQKNLEKAKT